MGEGAKRTREVMVRVSGNQIPVAATSKGAACYGTPVKSCPVTLWSVIITVLSRGENV